MRCHRWTDLKMSWNMEYLTVHGDYVWLKYVVDGEQGLSVLGLETKIVIATSCLCALRLEIWAVGRIITIFFATLQKN